MTPIFKEYESNGIYTAFVSVVMDTISGSTNLGNKFELDTNKVKERWLSDLVKEASNTGIVPTFTFEDYVNKEKKIGIALMYKSFNERIEREKQMLYEKDK